MNVSQWKKNDYNQLLTDIQKIWKITNDDTHLSFLENKYVQQYVNNIGPVCDRILRSKYRIGTYGFITKARIKTNGKYYFTNCFWKEISLDFSQMSPIIEIYASLCASWLRHNKKIKSLAYCYGYINGTLKQFTKEHHISSVINISNPTQYGFKIKDTNDKYAQIERMNEPVCLLSQEYLKLSFDDVIELWKSNDTTDEQLRILIHRMLIEICEGLYWMECEWGLYHNDLHPGNIMARKTTHSSNSVEWCIIDWGRATVQRDGVHKSNKCFTPTGPAYGHLKQASLPSKPTSQVQYSDAKSGGDMIGFICMIMKEEYFNRAMKHPEFDWLKPCIAPIKGDGLHVFNKANKWAESHSLTLSNIRTLLLTKKMPQLPSPLNRDESKLKTIYD